MSHVRNQRNQRFDLTLERIPVDAVTGPKDCEGCLAERNVSLCVILPSCREDDDLLEGKTYIWIAAID